METKPRFYIVAARSETDLADMTATLAYGGVPFITGFGFYRGEFEPIAMLVTRDPHAAMIVATLHDQNTYLAVSENDRTAYEVDRRTGFHTCLGKWREVTVHDSHDLDAWSCLEGRYFTAQGGGVNLPEGF